MTALCQCGCGNPAPVAPHNNRSKGWVKGEPRPFINRHNHRKKVRWLEENRGYESPCWIWQLSITQWGYGQAFDGERLRAAHRVVYEEIRGAIPMGLDLDHLCRVRCCVNPDHLEPVTRSENLRRGYAARRKEATR